MGFWESFPDDQFFTYDQRLFVSGDFYTDQSARYTSLDGLNIPDRTEIDTDFPIDQFR